MQFSFKRRKKAAHSGATPAPLHVGDLREGEEAILDRLDLPEDTATRLMELGFVPGTRIVAARSAPGGDPRVFRVDGSEIALRGETAIHLLLRR
jgi:ferrous iron transport protein A